VEPVQAKFAEFLEALSIMMYWFPQLDFPQRIQDVLVSTMGLSPAICGLFAGLRSGHPGEKDPPPTLWAPRTIIYPMEIADLIYKIRNGQ
jgi:hypothetical protein